MSTKNGVADIEYKTGITDNVICQLLQNEIPIDLTTFTTIVFNISDGLNHSFSVPCTIGNSTYPASEGGVTINFTAIQLEHDGEYECEFVANKNGELSIIPNGNEYYVLKVYPAIQVTL